MANTVNILGFANTFGDWVVATNAGSNEINSLGKGNWTKDTGTLILNGTPNGLQVANNAYIQGQLQVQGTGSSAIIQNNLIVGPTVAAPTGGGSLYLNNTVFSLYSSGQANIAGTLYVTGPSTGLYVSNNAIINGNTRINGIATIIGSTSITGTIGASNFSGTSSGTNTGDQTNISGTAGNITAATNSTLTTLSALSLPTSQLSGNVSITAGGTGQITQQAAINALTGTQTSGRYLRSDGTNATLSVIQAADLPGITTLGVLTSNVTANGTSAFTINIANPSIAATAFPLNIIGQLGWQTAGVGGPINITAGAANSATGGTGGTVTITGGAGFSGNPGGSVVLAGGLGAGAANGSVQVASGTRMLISNTASATSCTTGALVVTGGIGLTGSIYAGGNITAYSDARVKDNLVIIPDALNKVLQLNGYTYTRTDESHLGQKQTGLIAQEVLNVLPEAVSGSEETGYGVNYGNMVGLLVEAIKELKVEIEELKKGK
jgi:hypothetical protein